MKIIDLSKNSSAFAERYIREYCGGRTIESRWTNLLSKGIGGMTFIDAESLDESKTHKVVFSFFKDGLGFYFRNAYRNKLILLKKEQIKKIEIGKNADIIRPFSYSLYSILSGVGIGHNSAAPYLTPREIIKEERAFCSVYTEDQYFNFLLEKITPEKLVSVFGKSDLSHLIKEDIHSPQIITK